MGPWPKPQSNGNHLELICLTPEEVWILKQRARPTRPILLFIRASLGDGNMFPGPQEASAKTSEQHLSQSPLVLLIFLYNLRQLCPYLAERGVFTEEVTAACISHPWECASLARDELQALATSECEFPENYYGCDANLMPCFYYQRPWGFHFWIMSRKMACDLNTQDSLDFVYPTLLVTSGCLTDCRLV